MSPGRSRQTTHWLLVAGAVLVAGALRFYALGSLPPGLYHDEAYNGLDALRVLDGARPIFFEANNGREPLFIYLVALSVGLLGRTPVAIRAVSAVLGTLTVFAAYLMGRSLFNKRIGLVIAAVAAITVWPVNLSRIGFRAVALPLVSALMIWQLSRALATRRLGHFVAAGFLLGLALYTYLAARFVPLAVAVFLVIWVLRHRSDIPWRGITAFVLVAAVVATPLLGYVATNWETFTERAGQVSIFNPVINHGDFWGTLGRDLARATLMFNVAGDSIPRHNVPLRPVFDLVMGLMFLAGLAIALRRRSDADVLALVWVAILLVPTILAEDTPHFLRAAGVLPVLFVFPALGLNGLSDLGARFGREPVAFAAMGLVFATSLATTVHDYFFEYAPGQDAYYAFETGTVQLAERANEVLAEPSAHVYVSQSVWQPAMQFLVPLSDRLSDLCNKEQPPPAVRANLLVLLAPGEAPQPYLACLPENLAIQVEDGPPERFDLDVNVHPAALVISATPADTIAPARTAVDAVFGSMIQLVGADVSADGDQVQVLLRWHALQRPDRNYQVFVHVEQEGLPLVAGDAPPAAGYYTTDLWKPGDTVLDEHTVSLSRPFDAASDRITVGLYRLDTMERLPVSGSGPGVAADSVTLTGLH